MHIRIAQPKLGVGFRTELAVGGGLDDVLDFSIDEVIEGVDVLPHEPAELEEVGEELPFVCHVLDGFAGFVEGGGGGGGGGVVVGGVGGWG